MEPLITAAAINTAAQIGTSVASGIGSKRRYERQRRDALADYHMQNLYNSPAEQMKRLKAAGLNPNLVYGSGAKNEAAPVRSSQQDNPKYEAPQIDPSAFMGQYDVALKQAQTDNVKQATEVAKQEIALKAAQTASTVQGTSTSEFNLDLAKKLENISLEQASVALNKGKADLQYTVDNNVRQAILNNSTVAKQMEEVLAIRVGRAKAVAEINNLEKDGLIKQLEIKLRKLGLTSTDPAYMRIISQLLENPGKSVGDLGNKIWDFFVAPIPGRKK